jgi:hypothetical protein
VLRFYRAILALAALPAMLAVNNMYNANQGVTNTELQRYIYAPNYPTWCGAAGMAAREMRVKPTTDPKVLHGVMKANIAECANTSWVQQHPSVWNTAVFSASAAALLAARHEQPAHALRDATLAKNWSADLVSFTHQPGAGQPGPGRNLPSAYRTNAGRINSDATTLIGAIQASAGNTNASSDSLPTHVGSPGGSGASPNAAASAQP